MDASEIRKARQTVGLIGLASLGVLFAVYWFLLPWVQAGIVPRMPGGETGPWLFRPILAFHFGATAVLSALSAPVVPWLLGRGRSPEDTAAMIRDHQATHQTGPAWVWMLKAAVIFVVYLGGLFFYLGSWTVVGPDGIVERLPWTTKKHPYQEIVEIVVLPAGERSDSLKKDGPYYEFRLGSERTLSFSLDNEGATAEELAAMAQFVAARTGLPWMRRKDARPDR